MTPTGLERSLVSQLPRVAFTLFVLILPRPALATDGVLEINQTCATQTGCFPGDVVGFPVVTAPGLGATNYRLTSDLIVPDENTTGIIVSAPGASIDLNGFAIFRSGCETAVTNCTPAAGTGNGVSGGGVPGVSVKNGSIMGMGRHGVLLGDQGEVTNVRVRWNANAGINVGAGSIVSGSSAHENGDSGFRIGEGSIATRNTARGNTLVGIQGSIGTTISENVVTENTGGGITVFDSSHVIGNNASLNTGVGIAAVVGPSNITGNLVRANGGIGIDCRSGGGSDVQGNSVLGNTGLGIDLADPVRPNAIYRDNVIYDNTGGTVTPDPTLNRGGNTCRNFGTFTDCP